MSGICLFQAGDATSGASAAAGGMMPASNDLFSIDDDDVGGAKMSSSTPATSPTKVGNRRNSNLMFEAIPYHLSELGRGVRERRPGAPDGRPAEDEEGVLELRGRHPLPHLRVVPIKTGEKNPIGPKFRL